ncbi:MAG: metallophosphoesterase [Candidatus Aminicenantes bacterium]|nr:MAG: metallophosphoesterase [Candidatus Aminicenantes bacterium]
MSYWRMSKRFNQIYKKSREPENSIPFDPEKDSLAIFSDHHKGDGSAADDFKKNAYLYETALSFYKEKGFELIVLGDNEEFWENRYEQIQENYEEIIRKEIEIAMFTPEQLKIRIWGNHDKEVSLRRFKRLYKMFGKTPLSTIEFKEGLCLGEDIFLIHGHQGRFFEDKAWRVSRWAVQFVWKTIQKLFHIGNDGPAENFEIRDSLELHYYDWARKKRKMLICGHTHRAIFGSLTHFDRLQIEIRHLEQLLAETPSKDKVKTEKKIEDRKKETEKILKKRAGKEPKSFTEHPNWPVPCYFNDGCCGYTNGITCIEIDKGTIRLIKWQRQNFQRIILAEEKLQLLLKYIKESRPIDEILEPKLKSF